MTDEGRYDRVVVVNSQLRQMVELLTEIRDLLAEEENA